jgi:hypothetical protein
VAFSNLVLKYRKIKDTTISQRDFGIMKQQYAMHNKKNLLNSQRVSMGVDHISTLEHTS